MGDVCALDSTLADEHLAVLRDVKTAPSTFRRSVECLTTLVLAEALRDLAHIEARVETPITTTTMRRTARRITVVPILRAGLAMLEPALRLLPETTRVGFFGMARDERTLMPRTYLESIPDDLHTDDVVALDVMIATGGSCVEALSQIQALSPASLRLVGILAAPEGLARVSEACPDVGVSVACVDDHLNDRGFIVPGLGDAGDRLYAPARAPETPERNR